LSLPMSLGAILTAAEPSITRRQADKQPLCPCQPMPHQIQ
jgi:hypothetical protein